MSDKYQFALRCFLWHFGKNPTFATPIIECKSKGTVNGPETTFLVGLPPTKMKTESNRHRSGRPNSTGAPGFTVISELKPLISSTTAQNLDEGYRPFVFAWTVCSPPHTSNIIYQKASSGIDFCQLNVSVNCSTTAPYYCTYCRICRLHWAFLAFFSMVAFLLLSAPDLHVYRSTFFALWGACWQQNWLWRSRLQTWSFFLLFNQAQFKSL